jgi:hypothetical protein
MATSIGTLVLLKLEARQREVITLTGTGGTANVTLVGGLTKLATWATSLTVTAQNFVTSHAVAYLAVGVQVTAYQGKLYFESVSVGVAIVAPEITNVTTNLAGTVANAIANATNITIIGETSTSFKSAQNIIETSSKSSGNDAEFKSGRITRTMSVSSLASTDPTSTGYGFDLALAVQEQQSAISFLLTEYASGTPVTGAIKLSGSAFVSNVSWEVPDNDKMTFSLDLQVSGEVAVETN